MNIDGNIRPIIKSGNSTGGSEKARNFFENIPGWTRTSGKPGLTRFRRIEPDTIRITVVEIMVAFFRRFRRPSTRCRS